MPKDICQSVLDKIQHDNIKPTPRWEFLLKDYVFWLIFALSIVVGSLASSVMINLLRNNDWDLYLRASGGFVSFFFRSIPYFWILFFVCFVALAYYNFKHTKRAYRFSFYMIPLLSLWISLFGGVVIYNLGISAKIEQHFAESMPGYRRMTDHMRLIWQNPEGGLIAGTIVELGDGSFIYLTDLNDYDWRVGITRAEIRPEVRIEPEFRIKVVGEKMSDVMFEAREIRPFAGICMHELRGEPCLASQCVEGSCCSGR